MYAYLVVLVLVGPEAKGKALDAEHDEDLQEVLEHEGLGHGGLGGRMDSGAESQSVMTRQGGEKSLGVEQIELVSASGHASGSGTVRRRSEM